MTIEIIKDCELPEKGRLGGVAIYPFAKLVDINDGFEVLDDMGKTSLGSSSKQNSISSSARSYAKRHNPDAKFATRKIGDKILCVRVK